MVTTIAEVNIWYLGGGYPPRKFDFYAAEGSWRHRMGGEYSGDGHLIGCSAGAPGGDVAHRRQHRAVEPQWSRIKR
jgi:hypothetical protein